MKKEAAVLGQPLVLFTMLTNSFYGALAMKSMSTALSVRLITRLGCGKVKRRELTVRTYVSPTARLSKVKYPNELVDTLKGVASELPVSTISTLRIGCPSAVVTRPEMDALAAVGCRNSIP